MPTDSKLTVAARKIAPILEITLARVHYANVGRVDGATISDLQQAEIVKAISTNPILVQMEGELEETKICLGEAQQWIDSEPDWKDKYMANYLALEKENDQLQAAGDEFSKIPCTCYLASDGIGQMDSTGYKVIKEQTKVICQRCKALTNWNTLTKKENEK